MRLDRSAEDFEFDTSFGINTKNSCDSWIGIVTTGEDELSSDGNEAGACVDDPRPETAVIGHVHKVNGNVVVHDYSTISLLGVFASGVRDRVIKASVQPDDRHLGYVGEHDGEVRGVERRKKRKTSDAKSTKR
jgi:hypothetical protein